MADNKVKYGLKNVYYAPITEETGTEDPTFGTPVAWPGAVSLSLDAEGDINAFRADNIDYYITPGNNGYSGSLETALIPDHFRKAVLGEVEDDNGMLIEDAGAQAVPFALLFQFEGDQKATRHVMYKCVATRPGVASETTGEEIEPVTETVDLTCSSVYSEALDTMVTKAKCLEGSTNYNDFFTAVKMPEAAGE